MNQDSSSIIADRIIHLAWQSSSPCDAATTQLSGAQWAAVRFLARSNAISRKPSVFAEFHGTTRGTASQTLKSLETAGLAWREKDKTDGRSVRFSLTEVGEAIAQNDPVLRLSRVVNSLSDSDREKLGDLVEQLSVELAQVSANRCLGCCYQCHHFEPSGKDASPGTCLLNNRPEPVDDPSALCVYFEPA